MRRSVSVVVPTLACSLVGGAAVAAMAALGVRALERPAPPRPAGAPVAAPMSAPAPVVVRTPPPPPVTDAPTAPVWVTAFRG